MASKRNLKMSDVKPVQVKAAKMMVRDFAEFQGESSHVKLNEHLDETIYIVKMEIQASDQYGPGYKLYFKDLPNAAQTLTAGVHGQYPVAQLDALWSATNNGQAITESTPIRTTIRKAGGSYRFE